MTVPAQPSVPTPPSGYTWQLIWSDDFSGTASDPVAGITGLNRLYWNDGTFNGPNTPGQGTSATAPPGNTTESMSPSMISVNPGGDSCLHIKCVNNVVGGLQSLGLVGWNPAAHALPSNLATAKTNGQYVDLTGTICTELRVKQWGPSGSDNGNWWCWFGHYNMGDGTGSVVSTAYGSEHYSQEIDLSEQNGGDCTGAAWTVNWHAVNTEQYSSCYSSSLQGTDVSLAFHNLDYVVDPTGIYYTGTSWGFGQYCDGANSDTGSNPYASGSQVSAQYAEPMAMWIAGQLRGSANNTQTDYMVDYIAVWQLVTGTTPTKPSITTPSLPNTSVSTPYSTALTATGGTSPYTWSVSSGSLPVGLSINASKSLTLTLSGIPTVVGSSSFTIQITDANGYTASQAYNITVAATAAKISITTSSLPVGTVGETYNASLAAINGAPSSGGGFTLTPNIVQSVANDSAGTSLALNFGGSSAQGNTLLAFITTFGGTITAPANWQFVQNFALTGAGSTVSVYAYNAAPATSATSWSCTQAYIGGVMAEVTGLTVTVDASNDNSALVSANAGVTPSLGPSTAADLAFMIGTVSGSQTASPAASGWSQVNNTLNGFVSMFVMSQQMATGVTVPTESVTWSSSAGTAYNYGIAEIAFKAATSTSGGSATPSTLIQTAKNDVTASPLAITFSGASTVGNSLFAFIEGFATVTAPAGWTLVDTVALPHSGGSLYIFSYNAAPATTTASFTGSGYMGGIMVEVNGATVTLDVSNSGGATVTSNTGTVPALGPTTAYDIAFLIGTPNTVVSAATASGWGFLAGTVNSAVALFAMTQQLSSGVTAPAEAIVWSGPSSTATSYDMVVLAFKNTSQAGVANGPPIYTWSILSGALEAGLTLTAATGVISGTPTAAGAPSITFQVSDQTSAKATATLTLNVNAVVTVTTPAISTTGLPGATVGVVYSVALVASGGTTPYIWSLASGTLPAGLALNASSGVISGTPTAAGTSNFVVRLTDSSATPQTATASLSIVATASSSGVVTITTTALPTGLQGAAYAALLTESGGTGPYTWTISAGVLPSGLSLTASTGAITGQPSVNGVFPVTFHVADSASHTATQALSIQIQPSVILPPPQVNIGEVPNTVLTVAPQDYNALVISWDVPPGTNWNEQILLRSSFGSPTSIYASDGTVLLDQTDPNAPATPQGGWITSYVDVGLKPGLFYYYTLLVYRTDKEVYWPAGSSQGLVLTDWNFAEILRGWLPDFYWEMDTSGVLQAFTGLCGYEIDWIRSEIESFFLFSNLNIVSGAILPALGSNLGVEYEPELGMTRSRVLLQNAVFMYKWRGTTQGIEAAASAFTGFTCVQTLSQNLEPQLDYAAFDLSLGGTQGWAAANAATSISVVKAPNGVQPAQFTYNPAPSIGNTTLTAYGYLPNPNGNQNVAQLSASGAVLDITTCNSANAQLLGLPVTQTTNQFVVSAYIQPSATAALRSFYVQIDWYAANGALISSSAGTAVAETAPGVWIRPYVAALPPAGAVTFGRTVKSTAVLDGHPHYLSAVQTEIGLASTGSVPSSWAPPRDIQLNLLPVRQNLVVNPQGKAAATATGWSVTGGTLTPSFSMATPPAVIWPAKTTSGFVVSGALVTTGKEGAATIGTVELGAGYLVGEDIGGTISGSSAGNVVITTAAPVNPNAPYSFSLYLMPATTPRTAQLTMLYYDGGTLISGPVFTGVLSAPLVVGVTYDAIFVQPLPFAYQLGQPITINPGGAVAQLVLASGSVAAGQTSIPTDGFVANQNYPAGTLVAFGYTAFSEVPGVFTQGSITGLITPSNATQAVAQLTIIGVGGEQHYLGAPLLEPAAALRPYFDGSFRSFPGGDYVWEGTPHDSVSDYYPNFQTKLAMLVSKMPDYVPIGATFSLLTGAQALLNSGNVG